MVFDKELLKKIIKIAATTVAVAVLGVIGGHSIASGGEIESFELRPTVYPTLTPTVTPRPTSMPVNIRIETTSNFRQNMSVGTRVSKDWFRVYKVYSRGYYEWDQPREIEIDNFRLLNDEITSTGVNYIFIEAEGFTREVMVYGTKPMDIAFFYAKTSEQLADYQKDYKIYVGDKINQDWVEGTVYFNNAYPYESDDDGEQRFHKDLTGKYLTISPQYLTKIGDNEITVSYAGYESPTKIHIYAEPRLVYGISAEYRGNPVAINHYVNGNDIAVTVKYMDSPTGDAVNTTVQTKDFYIVGGLITKEDLNQVYVYYKDPYNGKEYMATVDVPGINKGGSGVGTGGAVSNLTPTPTPFGGVSPTPDLNYGAPTNDIDTIAINPPELQDVDLLFKDYLIRNPKWDSKNDTWITLLTGDTERAESIYIQMLTADTIRNAVTHVVDTKKFIGFHINYIDPEACLEFPMWGVCRRPDSFDADRFAVYYTPDKKSTMARTHGLYLDENKEFYAFVVFEPGWYAMLETVEDKKISSINIEKSEITLKPDRNYSLEDKIVIIPVNATKQTLEYTSSNPQVAQVDSETGMIRAISEGTAYIFIESTDGSGVYKRIKVTVK